MKKKFIYVLMGILIVALIGVSIYAYNANKNSQIVSTNEYNMSFYELVDFVENVKVYLAKSLISNSSEHGATTLTHLWKEATLAQTYLAMLPLDSQELANTEKFLNQVSDYSYSLAHKCIRGEELNDDDMNNLEMLYEYSNNLSITLNQLGVDLSSGAIDWGELKQQDSFNFTQEVSSTLTDSFSSLEENFHEYEGLIYDGAFSEHIVNIEKKGLTGDEIDEQTAQNKAVEFIGGDRISEITFLGFYENANIPVYSFDAKIKDTNLNINIAISKKGGHVVLMDSDRDVLEEHLNYEQADAVAKKFLEERGFTSMRETYYLNESGVLTINYAYQQDGVVMYADLIKVKVALDNGEILGVETTGYLNSHHERQIERNWISIEQAKQNLNPDLNIASEGVAMIPTEFQTEILCFEFKGKIGETEYLVYINAVTGIEEDILVIINTPNGVLTM